MTATATSKTNGSAGMPHAAAPEKVSPARIIRQLVKGTDPAKVADRLGVHISTVYYHRKRAIESGELTGPKTKTKTKAGAKSAAPKKKTPGKRGTKAARGAALDDAIVYLQHAQDAGAPELRHVSNGALLAELALRRLDGRM